MNKKHIIGVLLIAAGVLVAILDGLQLGLDLPLDILAVALFVSGIAALGLKGGSE